MWDLPRSGLEPVSPALAGRFLTTVPPGKPWIDPFIIIWCTSLSLVTVFDLKSILSEINIATPVLFWLRFAWNLFFHPFTWNRYVSLHLKCFFDGQHVVGRPLKTTNFLKIFIYLFWLHWVLVVAHRIFVVARGIFSCGMHAGSISPTRDRTWAPCIGSTES